MELNIPAIHGIGGSLIYLVDRYGDRSIYDVDFVPRRRVRRPAPTGVGLTYIDHLTHNVHRGRMDAVGAVLRAALRFPRDPLFRHSGQETGPEVDARWRAPCGKIRIPINEPSDDKSQIEEYLAGLSAARASSTSRSRRTTSTPPSSRLRERGVKFMDMPDTYYDAVDKRLPGHGEDLERLQRDRILIDGAPTRTAASCCRSSPKP